MNIILFDDEHRVNLLPLAFTRPIADFRIGILTIKEKWAHYFDATYSYATAIYLQVKYPQVLAAQNLFINGAVLPNPALKKAIENLNEGEALVHGNLTLAVNTNTANFQIANAKQITFDSDYIYLKNLSAIFSFNDQALRADYDLLTASKTSQALDANSTLVGNQLFIEPGAKVSCAIFNTETGPIYIGKDAEVLEGAIIRGPFALGECSILKMGAKVYGATTVGPFCKVGGEVNNSVLFGYSSKGHEGFLGNSVLGEWCNIGADSNTSNLKNNYAEVKLWNYQEERFTNTGLQFCGLMMGDHSKCGINTMFNTGTVIGVSANIFGSGFPRNFVPSFSWGGATGFTTYQLKKVFEVAKVVMKRRGLELTETDEKILHYVFDETSKNRTS